MEFDRVLEDGRLWAVKMEGEGKNAFDLLFSKWYDLNWLKDFFGENLSDLSSYFHNLVQCLHELDRGFPSLFK